MSINHKSQITNHKQIPIPNTQNSQRSGEFKIAFTFVELLITVSILSTAIIFVFRSFTTSLNVARFAQNMTLACYLAEDKIWQIETAHRTETAIPRPGNETQGNTAFNWNYTVGDTGLENLKELKFLVSWEEGTRARPYQMEFVTLITTRK
jgi:type II secretion system protein I